MSEVRFFHRPPMEERIKNLEKEIETPEEVIAKIDKVTLQEVEGLAKKYFKEETLNLAIIGNFSDRQKFEKLLKL